MNKPLTVILYGLSGSGKGTQADLLRKRLAAKDGRTVLHIETGARLREFIKKNGHTQKVTAGVMASGGLLPSFLPVHVWTEALIGEFTGEEHLILDGLARRDVEAPILDGALWFYGRGDYQVIEFALAEDEAKRRLIGRGRSDGMTEEAIKRRFDWYNENVRPAIEWFEKNGRPLHRIDAAPSPEEIHETIIERLGI